MPQVKHYATVSGYSLSGSGASAGLIIISLRDWSERDGKEDDVNSIIGRINTLSQKIPDAQLFAAAPPMINGYGMVNGLNCTCRTRRANLSVSWTMPPRDSLPP